MVHNISVRNQKIIDVLNHTSTLDLNDKRVSRIINFDVDDYDTVKDFATSRTHLNHKLKNSNGKIEYNSTLVIGETEGGIYLINHLKELLNFDYYYTAGYYPKGFVGWHNDTDIHGYYIMLSYSESGDGFFRYLLGSNIITICDDKGWMARYVEIGKNPTELLWHCAVANCPRYTFLLHYTNRDDVKKAISIIQEVL